MIDAQALDLELVHAADSDFIGMAVIEADRSVASRLGQLSGWLAPIGADCCDSVLLIGLERELSALMAGERASIVLPGVRGVCPSFPDAVTATIIWNARSQRFLILTVPDFASRQVEALLGTERRARRMAEEQLEAASAEVKFAMVARERLRLARDLHDTLGHSIVALLMQIRLIRHLTAANPSQVAEELAKVEQAAAEGLAQTREAIERFRNPELEQLDLWQDLDEIVESAKQNGDVDVTIDIDDAARTYFGDHANILHRIIKEAVHNIAKHARARRVAIRARIVHAASSSKLDVAVTDDGAGFDMQVPRTGRFGLVGMAELAALAGGGCEVTSAPGSGTTVRITIPITVPAHRTELRSVSG